MNEHLSERFGRSRRPQRDRGPSTHQDDSAPKQELNLKVRQYFDESKQPTPGGPWLRYPEYPTATEVLDLPSDEAANAEVVELVPNKRLGPWPSKEDYLSAHYELLREDALRNLREAVSQVRATPQASEAAFSGAIGIYEKVHICGVTCSTRGMAIRVTFSLYRTGKQIRWDQSGRLITGSLVVLTTKRDPFQNKAIVAVVAGRPLSGLEQNPPEIDLFIVRPEEQEIDPAEEWLMIEDRGGLYEAERHTLLALQRMMKESFPLQEHLVRVKDVVDAPAYLRESPKLDMSSVLDSDHHQDYRNVDVLHDWPTCPSSALDPSQLDALRRILTRRLALVQGPPGTGKTFVSVQAVKLMLENRSPDDPPLIIACQTNHAVDQILRHIAKFEPDFVRLGGRSKDRDVVKSRTLFEVRQQTSRNPLNGGYAQNARKKLRELEKELAILLSPLKPDKTPLKHRLLQSFNLLTAAQADSLERTAAQWVQTTSSTSAEATSPFQVWLAQPLVPVPAKQQPEDFGFDFEEVDQEVEQLKEAEAETATKDDDDFETLRGAYIPVADNFTCKKVAGVSEAQIVGLLSKEQDLWKIPAEYRPQVYRHLQAEMKKKLLDEFRVKTKQLNEVAQRRRIGNFENDETILKTQKIIGMTTTGFSKYRGLLSALSPKVVLIEEAGELLEAPVAVTCLPTLEHLILVGDHKQLRPHCHVLEHEEEAWGFNISLFERLIANRIEFTMLKEQRRMAPEIRRMLYPIYGDKIVDHESVRDRAHRPDIPGMGGINSFFFTHQWPEQRDEYMSAINPQEAAMVVGFVEYLVCNGTQAEDITVLTFYNGQRKRILGDLRKKPTLAQFRFHVATVDSYQGEENRVVILSLVRSNETGKIGFLGIDNRVCVALSRAQCGFFIFGNGMLLYENNKTWKEVVEIMAGRTGKMRDKVAVEPVQRLEQKLPLCCKNHNNVTDIRAPEDWDGLSGGCAAVQCTGTLPCGHRCALKCHPFAHDLVSCFKSCGKTLACGHPCTALCSTDCVCPCASARSRKDRHAALFPAADAAPAQAAWGSFATTEPARLAAAASAAVADGFPSLVPDVPGRGGKASKRQPKLVDTGPSDDEMENGMSELSLADQQSRNDPSPPVSVERRSGPNGRHKWTEKYRASPTRVPSGAARNGDEVSWRTEESLLD